MKASIFSSDERLELMSQDYMTGLDVFVNVGGQKFELLPMTPHDMAMARNIEGAADNLAFVRAYLAKCARATTERAHKQFEEPVFDEWFDNNFDIMQDTKVMEHVMSVLTEVLKVDPKSRVEYGRSRGSNGLSLTSSAS